MSTAYLSSVDESTDGTYRGAMVSALTKQQMDAWRSFRYMVEETSLDVSRALSSSGGLTGGQFGILSILVTASTHAMRQQELANAMRWDRTRLSHQLTRMERKDWINREKGIGGSTLVRLEAAGKKEQERAAPLVGQIVKERFFDRLTEKQLAQLAQIREALKTSL